MTYKYHLVPDGPISRFAPPKPLCGQERPTKEDGYPYHASAEPVRFVAILVQDHLDGDTHLEHCWRALCEHCEAIAASKKTSGGLYRCDGRLLG